MGIAPDSSNTQARIRVMKVAIIAILATLVGLSIYLGHARQSSIERLVPLLRQSSAIHVELDHFHKWFEEYVRGRQRVAEDQVWRHFDHVPQAVDLLREQLRTIELSTQTFGGIKTAQRLTTDMNTLDRALSSLRTAAQDRMALKEGSARIPEFDARFDTNLSAVILAATKVQHTLENLMYAQIGRMRNVTLMLYVLFIVGVLAAWWMMRRQEQARRAQVLDLHKLGPAVEQSPASVMITDTQGLIEYVNPKFEQVSGYSAHEVLGKNPRILKSGLTTQIQYKVLWDTIRAGKTWRGEFRNRRKDGSLYWEMASISPIRGDDGTIHNFVAVKEDITARKIQENQVRQSRELFSRAFHSNPALIALSHPITGEHVDVNEAWCQTLKYTREEAIGNTAFDMGLWANLEDRKRILAELTEHGRLRNFQTQLKAKDGALIDCLISSEPIHMGDQELVLWSANDITARRKSERERDYQHTLFQAIFNGIPDGIIYSDRDRTILAVNPGIKTQFGYEPHELIGQKPNIIYADEGDYERMGRLRFNENARTSTEPLIVNYRRRDGSVFPGEALGTPIYDADGDPLGFIGVIRDVTERKRIEGQLVHAKEEAEYANYAKSQFLANMSHELRTPLNAILGFAELIRMEAFGPLGSDKYGEYIDDIHESGRHLLDIITDILDVSKIEAGRLDLNFEDVMLDQVIGQCVMILENQAIERGVTLETVATPGLPHLDADPLRLKQIVLNLVNNAIKFNAPGGRVSIETLLNGVGGIVLIVTDTGIGMKEDDLKRALEPFGQVSDITNRPHAGSGLGLSLSKALMELHGGRINVDSIPGEGTQVACIFPPERTIGPENTPPTPS